jgi:hypothetical protein
VKSCDAAIQVPGHHADHPAGQEAPAMEPARVEREHHGRQRLEHPDPAEQLEVDRELRRQEQDERERTGLHDERHGLRHLGLLAIRAVLPHELPSRCCA